MGRNIDQHRALGDGGVDERSADVEEFLRLDREFHLLLQRGADGAVG